MHRRYRGWILLRSAAPWVAFAPCTIDLVWWYLPVLSLEMLEGVFVLVTEVCALFSLALSSLSRASLYLRLSIVSPESKAFSEVCNISIGDRVTLIITPYVALVSFRMILWFAHCWYFYVQPRFKLPVKEEAELRSSLALRIMPHLFRVSGSGLVCQCRRVMPNSSYRWAMTSYWILIFVLWLELICLCRSVTNVVHYYSFFYWMSGFR